jgi:ABC-type phosphate/phosphonate transport system substrate-binding protein
LYEYGNTRESDLINYCVKKFNYSSEEMKKVIKRMVIKGKIHYIVHSKLEPPEVYISLKELLPPEIAKTLIEAFIQMKAREEDVQKILDEAASIAEQTK